MPDRPPGESSVARHYDAVTDAWQRVLGSNLHYGWFEEGDDLEAATQRLTDQMASMSPLPPGSDVLDVGCGVGTPALRLAASRGYKVTGISISSRGVDLARESATRASLAGTVRFEHLDALSTGFSDGSFHLIWLQESSHLIRDKTTLMSELYRLQRHPGQLLLCDLMLGRAIGLPEVYQRRDDLTILESVFGKVQAESIGSYGSYLAHAGFVEVETRDITEQCRPTVTWWKKNLHERRAEILRYISESDWSDFVRACDVIDRMFGEGFLTYQIMSAWKK